MINIRKNFDSNLLKSNKNIDIYYIGYIAITKVDNYEKNYSAKSFVFNC